MLYVSRISIEVELGFQSDSLGICELSSDIEGGNDWQDGRKVTDSGPSWLLIVWVDSEVRMPPLVFFFLIIMMSMKTPKINYLGPICPGCLFVYQDESIHTSCHCFLSVKIQIERSETRLRVSVMPIVGYGRDGGDHLRILEGQKEKKRKEKLETRGFLGKCS